MAKLRSYFANDLSSLKESITSILERNFEGSVEPLDVSNLYHRLDCVFLTLSNREFSDLICKK